LNRISHYSTSNT